MESFKQNEEARKESGELSIRDLILKLIDWIRYLWKKKVVIVLFGLLGAGLGILYSYIKKPLYIAELTFVVEDSKSGPLGAYAGIASQFGIDLGGSSSNGAFSGDNILALLKSRLLIERALLFGRINDNGKQVTLADWYIKYNDLEEKWKNKPELKDLHFPVNSDRSNFTLQQDSILNTIQKKIENDYLLVEKTDKKLSFISVTCSTTDELFSKLFTEKLVHEALNLYIDTKVQRNKMSVDRLQNQADSLEAMLNRKTYSAAVVQDININPAKQVAAVGVELALRDKVVLQTMYLEVVKNLELSKLAMAQETPIIQIVDTPILPLEKKRFGKLKGIIIGGFIGGLIISMWLVVRRVYKELVA